jgi:hypothetical protein
VTLYTTILQIWRNPPITGSRKELSAYFPRQRPLHRMQLSIGGSGVGASQLATFFLKTGLADIYGDVRL